MQINSISNNLFSSKINNNFGKKQNNIDRQNQKPTDKYPEDYEKLDIYKKSEKPIDMSKVFEANILGNSTSLTKDDIKKIEEQATRDELGQTPSDDILLSYIINGGDPSVLSEKELDSLEPYLFLD